MDIRSLLDIIGQVNMGVMKKISIRSGFFLGLLALYHGDRSHEKNQKQPFY
jgi:hypothetical protein